MSVRVELMARALTPKPVGSTNPVVPIESAAEPALCGTLSQGCIPPTMVLGFENMPRGNPSPKLAITVDSEVHRRVVTAAEEEGVSVSAWMTEAARRALLIRDGLAAVAEWERINGAFTDEEMLEARRRVATEVATRRKRSA